MIKSPFSNPLANFFDRSGNGKTPVEAKTDGAPSISVSELQDLIPGDLSKYGAYDGLLFICLEGGEEVIDMRHPEREPESPSLGQATAPRDATEIAVPGFLEPQLVT